MPAFIPSSYKDEKIVNSDEFISLVILMFSFDKETESFDIIIVISVEKSSGEEELIIKFDNISAPKRIIPSFGSLNKVNSKK